MRPSKTAQLAKIAQIAFQADHARMAELQRLEERFLAQIEDVRRHERAARERAPDTMSFAGRDHLWERWIEARLSALQTELAQVKARKADLLSDMRKSFGRKVAADSLAASVKAREALERARRATWTE